MNTFLMWGALLLNLMPALLGAMRAAEEFFGPGNGPAKLEFVMAGITEAVNATPEIKGGQRETLTRLVLNLVNWAVKLANATGVFKSANAEPVTSAINPQVVIALPANPTNVTTSLGAFAGVQK